MISKALKVIFGSSNDRELKRMRKIVNRINALTEDIAALSDEELRAKTEEFKRRLATGETLAHLNCLLGRRRITRIADADGVNWYEQIADTAEYEE